MIPEEIENLIKRQFDECLAKGEVIIKELNESDAYGHAAGTPLEHWVLSFLDQNEWNISFPNDFLTQLIQGWPKNKGIISEKLDSFWWAKLIVSPSQIDKYIQGERINRWQQEAADLILFYGKELPKDANDVILINVKSHDVSRSSRPPNIISAQRLLQFFVLILSNKKKDYFIDKLNYWFIGVDYRNDEKGGIIQKIYVKDLFKLDTDKIPQINFDAAIQIQWHVRDMEEIDQTKQDFIKNLSSNFINQWRNHAKRKSEKYELLVKKIYRLL